MKNDAYGLEKLTINFVRPLATVGNSMKLPHFAREEVHTPHAPSPLCSHILSLPPFGGRARYRLATATAAILEHKENL